MLRYQMLKLWVEKDQEERLFWFQMRNRRRKSFCFHIWWKFSKRLERNIIKTLLRLEKRLWKCRGISRHWRIFTKGKRWLNGQLLRIWRLRNRQIQSNINVWWNLKDNSKLTSEKHFWVIMCKIWESNFLIFNMFKKLFQWNWELIVYDDILDEQTKLSEKSIKDYEEFMKR